MREEWTNFAGGKWESDIDVRDFIQKNYTPYDGDQSFLEGPTEATDKLWGELKELQKEERAKGGVLDMETEVVSGITAYGAAYLHKDLEKVVGHARCMATLQALNSTKSLQNITRLTTRVYSISTLPR